MLDEYEGNSKSLGVVGKPGIGAPLFDEFAVNYDTEHKEFELLTFSAFRMPSGEPKINYQVHDSRIFLSNSILTMGADRITSQIRNKTHKATKTEWAKRLFFDKIPISEIGQDEAIENATRLAKLVHEDVPQYVGATEDVLVLKRDGLSWEFEDTDMDAVLKEMQRRKNFSYWPQVVLTICTMAAVAVLGFIFLSQLQLRQKRATACQKTPNKVKHRR
ncbi:MAG: hypothetical protein U0103_02990 [Candidatus Obscuribacterales bacterium]